MSPRSGSGRPGHRISPARRVASEAAIESASRGIPISEVLSRKFTERLSDARDRALVEEIAFGSVRHRASLDAALAKFSKKRLWKLDPEMLEVLRKAAYQLLFLDRIPDHAAVGEAVDLAKHWVGSSGGSFANGVLRALARSRGRKVLDLVGERDRRRLYWREGTSAELDREVLPSPERDLAAYLAGHYSQEKKFVQRLVKLFGEGKAEEILRWANELPPLTVRVNRLKAPGDGDLARLFEGASAWEPVEGLAGAWRVEAPGAPGNLPGLAEGLYSVQDATAQRAVIALDPRPGDEVLDLCAAPGTKTAQAAELMEDNGHILAVDPDGRRLDLVGENAERLGLGIVEARRADGRDAAAELAGRFDRVLVDAACSNSGVMNRRVEARWRLDPESVERIARLQLELLAAGLAAARPGGRVVYSTCSVLPEENSRVVAAALESRDGFRLAREEAFLPEAGLCDGGYLAVIDRR